MAKRCIQQIFPQNIKKDSQATLSFCAGEMRGPHNLVQSQIRGHRPGGEQKWVLQSKFDEIWIDIHKVVWWRLNPFEKKESKSPDEEEDEYHLIE